MDKGYNVFSSPQHWIIKSLSSLCHKQTAYLFVSMLFHLFRRETQFHNNWLVRALIYEAELCKISLYWTQPAHKQGWIFTMRLTGAELFNDSNSQKRTEKASGITITGCLNTTITSPLRGVKVKGSLIQTASSTLARQANFY